MCCHGQMFILINIITIPEAPILTYRLILFVNSFQSILFFILFYIKPVGTFRSIGRLPKVWFLWFYHYSVSSITLYWGGPIYSDLNYTQWWIYKTHKSIIKTIRSFVTVNINTTPVIKKYIIYQYWISLHH